MRRLALVALVVVAVAGLVAGCGSDSGGSSAGGGGKRPSTSARLAIVEPSPNQVVGPDVTVTLQLQGAKVVPQTTGKLSGTEGHIHLSVDGKLVSMAFTTSQQVTGLAPGQHSIQAEFVAKDHLPFANRVVAAVLFTVKAQ
ncbi:MAG TPA: hypothetical protein VGF22_08105 [Acidimicrobiales bacterium]|jgi:hypothetical protein